MVAIDRYQHDGADFGRAIADATFHRFADNNWNTASGCPTFVDEPAGGGMAREAPGAKRHTGLRAQHCEVAIEEVTCLGSKLNSRNVDQAACFCRRIDPNTSRARRPDAIAIPIIAAGTSRGVAPHRLLKRSDQHKCTSCRCSR